MISDRTRIISLTTELNSLADTKGVPASVRDAMGHVVQRINQCVQDLIIQLNSRPIIYTVNPLTNPNTVKGARPGDICVFKNTEGDVEIMQF